VVAIAEDGFIVMAPEAMAMYHQDSTQMGDEHEIGALISDDISSCNCKWAKHGVD
jgi:hypothetical protein